MHLTTVYAPNQHKHKWHILAETLDQEKMNCKEKEIK